MILDEMGQADGREVGDIIYMLGNGAGKQRAGRSGAARSRKSWRILFLSTGELTLETKMAEAGKASRAGQDVRLINVPADAGAGMGVFEALHGIASPGVLAEHLRAAAVRCYGTASRRFLERLAADRVTATETIREVRTRFEAKHIPQGETVSGQVRSVAARFALAAAAGELAIGYGVLPWDAGEAMAAAGKCFTAWLAERGGAGTAEDTKAIAQVRAFVEAHGGSRFAAIWEERDPSTERIVNRAGYKRRRNDGGWEYLFFPQVWKDDVCKGLDASAAARALLKAGYLTPGESGNLARKASIPGEGGQRPRFYVVSGILAAEVAA
jgi:putative DNA primase/helicase